ncbi:MAG: acyltransferase family protein [Actinomycetota bacterium]
MSERRIDIQGLRGVAVSVVVLYHAGLLFSGGFLGVDMFFAISGFVITASLTREARGTGRFSLRNFYGRRARRLLPASALAIAFTVALSTLFAAHTAARWTAHSALAALVFNANHYLALFGTDGGYFGADAQSNPLLHLWSLSVEEQFYFVFPALLMWVWARSRRRPATALKLLGVVAAASLACHVYLAHIAPGVAAPTWSFYLAPARAWEFLAGVLAAIAVDRGFRIGGRWKPGLNTAALLTVVAVSLMLDNPSASRVLGPFLAVTATTVLLISGAEGASQPAGFSATRLLQARPLVVVGDISYSWYLWHWPLIVFAHATWPFSPIARPVAALLSLPPAWLSTRLIEQRFRGRSAMDRRRMGILVASSVALPALVAVGLRQAEPQLAAWGESGQFAHHLDTASGCNDDRPLSIRPTDSCIWNDEGANGEMLLIGDSNAGHFSEAALSAAQRHGLRLRIATLDSCPFVQLRVFRNGGVVHGCEQFVSDALAWARANPVRIVVMASASDLYIADSEFALGMPGLPLATAAATKARYWEQALTKTLTGLRSAGVRTLLIHPVPKFPTRWSPAEWSGARFWMGTDSLDEHMSTSVALARQSRGADPERRVLDATGTPGLDPFTFMCPTPSCTVTRDGAVWFRDSRHISVSASESFGTTLSAAVEEALTV